MARSLFANDTRRLLSFVFAGLMLAACVGTDGSTLEKGWASHVMGWSGLLLVAAGCLGRTYASLFISGRKRDHLVKAGPYRLTRHPLYLFSFIAMLGLGITSTNPLVIIGLAGFLVYYHHLCRREEQTLAAIHGSEFEHYRRTVPRLRPRLRRDEAVPNWLWVSPRRIRRRLLDGIWFFIAWVSVRAITLGHDYRVLPAYELPI
jgi:protein-S-isoprenylcysteine O-methyltransferase Ste14